MVLELSDGRSRLLVTPENGGGIARFDALVTGRAPVALLRPWDGAGPLGCELLIPWSNRISGGGFEFDGRFHAVEPNIAGEALPIHGDGMFQYLNQAKRYRSGDWPKGEPKFFDASASISQFATLPPTDVPPDYPCKGCPSTKS